MNVTVPPIQIETAPVIGSGQLCQNFKADGIASKIVSCTPIVVSTGFSSIATCRAHFKSYQLNTDMDAHAGVVKYADSTPKDAFTNVYSFVKYSCTAN